MNKNVKNSLIIVCLLLLINGCNNHESSTPTFPFKDPGLSVDERVQDLVGRLTMEEKLEQLFNGAPAIERLGIPSYDWWNECLHGVARAGKATVFPQAIGLAATFDTALMSQVAAVISDEARAKHNYFVDNDIRSIYTGLTFWSPNINIFRDPRWGRGQETYGEDPYLTGRMAVSFINGLQGNHPKYFKTIATAKHYAVHSGPEFSRHEDNFDVSDRDLYQTYLPAFKMAVEEANVQSVMCAYNRFRDDPCCGSNLLLDRILREEFGFNGYVVSDCGAISDFYKEGYHEVAGSPNEAWGWSMGSGTDLNCEVSTAFMEDDVLAAIHNGTISEEDVNLAVSRLFKARIELGLFDPADMVPWSSLTLDVVGSLKHLEVAEEAARQSLVLLKNNGVLPLAPDKKIAVIGPNANNHDIIIGNYNGTPIEPVTPLTGFRERFGNENVLYSQGTPLVPGVYGDMEIVPAERLSHNENGRAQHGLKAEYFSTVDFSGEPALVQVDNNVDFFWERSPVNNLLEDTFSVRWSGHLTAEESGEYMFGGTVDVIINGENAGDSYVTLEAGKQYDIVIEKIVEKHWWANTISPDAQLKWINTSTDFTSESLDIAEKSDVIVFFGGISSRLEGEEMPLDIDGFSHGDRTSIDLPKVQEDLLNKLKALGKPIVVVNCSGSAIALNWAERNSDAIVQAFYPGERTGSAIAALMAGDFSPSGKLPVTFYRSTDDLPPFKEYAMTNRTYKYYEGNPLYPFGYGLTYSQFAYRLDMEQEKITAGSAITGKATITNTGQMEAAEAVQFYLTDREAGVPVPLKQLVGLTKVKLKPGESIEVSIDILPEHLQVISDNGERRIEPGEFGLVVCGSTGDVDPNAGKVFVVE